MNEVEKNANMESSRVDRRRDFIKKAATGVAITSLPAKSVWGACSVSGAMSGNLSTNTDRHDCPPPVMLGGLSPGFWKTVYEGNGNGLNGGFNHVNGGPENDAIRECYRTHIQSIIDSTVMDLSTAVNPGVVVSLKDALTNPGGLEYNLAGVFLSSYFGFYPTLSEGSVIDANSKVQEILFYVQIETIKESSFVLDFQFDTQNTTTNYAVSSCDTFPPAADGDGDKDGVPDSIDQCPNTRKRDRDKVGPNGCKN